jgi:hypothetical protein
MQCTQKILSGTLVPVVIIIAITSQGQQLLGLPALASISIIITVHQGDGLIIGMLVISSEHVHPISCGQ